MRLETRSTLLCDTHSRSASIPCTEFTESVCTHKFLHVINGDLTSCEILGLVFAKWVTWGKQLCSSFIDLCIGCRYTKFQVAPLFARTKAPMLVLLVLKTNFHMRDTCAMTLQSSESLLLIYFLFTPSLLLHTILNVIYQVFLVR